MLKSSAREARINLKNQQRLQMLISHKQLSKAMKVITLLVMSLVFGTIIGRTLHHEINGNTALWILVIASGSISTLFLFAALEIKQTFKEDSVGTRSTAICLFSMVASFIFSGCVCVFFPHLVQGLGGTGAIYIGVLSSGVSLVTHFLLFTVKILRE